MAWTKIAPNSNCFRNVRDQIHCYYCEEDLPRGSEARSHICSKCMRARKNIARYVERERRNRLELDRIDKALFILPFLTLADTVSTEFSLMFDGMEGGLIAGPVYEQYGQFGLVALTIFSFFASLGYVWFLRHAKRRVVQGEGPKLNRVSPVYAVLFFFLEAYIMGVVVQNFLVLFLSSSPKLFAIQYGVTLAYFVSVILFARTEVKQFTVD